MTRDDNGENYDAPHWTKTPARSKPILFIRKSKVTIAAKFELNEAPAAGRSFVVRAKGPNGIKWPETAVTIAGVEASFPATASDTMLPDTVNFISSYTIDWEVKETVANQWKSAGSSENKLYESLDVPKVTPLFYTCVHLACASATGESTINGTKMKIWSAFSVRSVTKVNDTTNGENGATLSYYKDYNNQNLDTATLLKNEDGQCGSWASLLIDSFKVNGIQDANNYIIMEPTAHSGFYVKNWSFVPVSQFNVPINSFVNVDPTVGATGYTFSITEVTDQAGIPGQNTANPASIFNNHQFVAVGPAIWDSSYGVQSSLNAYEDASVEAFFDDVNVQLPGPGGAMQAHPAHLISKNVPNVNEVTFSAESH